MFSTHQNKQRQGTSEEYNKIQSFNNVSLIISKMQFKITRHDRGKMKLKLIQKKRKTNQVKKSEGTIIQ